MDAPCAKPVASAGMLNAAQCQKPAAVGASGSKQVTAMDLVPSGSPDQFSSGETDCGARNFSAMGSPSAMSGDVSSNVGRSFSGAYGSGPGKFVGVLMGSSVPKGEGACQDGGRRKAGLHAWDSPPTSGFGGPRGVG